MTIKKSHKRKPGPTVRYNWVEIKAAYFSDPAMTYQKLSQLFGPCLSMVIKVAGKEKWSSQRKQLIEEYYNANRPK